MTFDWAAFERERRDFEREMAAHGLDHNPEHARQAAPLDFINREIAALEAEAGLDPQHPDIDKLRRMLDDGEPLFPDDKEKQARWEALIAHRRNAILWFLNFLRRRHGLGASRLQPWNIDVHGAGKHPAGVKRRRK